MRDEESYVGAAGVPGDVTSNSSETVAVVVTDNEPLLSGAEGEGGGDDGGSLKGEEGTEDEEYVSVKPFWQIVCIAACTSGVNFGFSAE